MEPPPGAGDSDGSLVGECRESHIGKLARFLLAGLKHIFDNLLFRLERFQVVESHRLNRNADNLILRDTERALLHTQIMLTRLR